MLFPFLFNVGMLTLFTNILIIILLLFVSLYYLNNSNKWLNNTQTTQSHFNDQVISMYKHKIASIFDTFTHDV